MTGKNRVYNIGMVKVIASLFVGLLLLSGCSDGHYRYPCQDPNNWEDTECKPPVCSAAGACPEDLVGKDLIEEGVEE